MERTRTDVFHITGAAGVVQEMVGGPGFDGQGKIAEPGGANLRDRSVPLLVSGKPVDKRGVNSLSVETTQIAPTILRLLGLDPSSLQAVQLEATQALPIGD